ncbi:MAG: hypothetical protein KatS3mg131_1908 [Candidatus Tectimicrobiota bacterium]|nr:MAG: hypothetical protein KatS3mg131_1908 [Candidatus Tectomicrobia bacterium]
MAKLLLFLVLLALSSCQPPAPRPPAAPTPPPPLRQPSSALLPRPRRYGLPGKPGRPLRLFGPSSPSTRSRRLPTRPCWPRPSWPCSSAKEETARQAYQTLIARFPDSEHLPAAYLGLAVVFYRLGDDGQSQALLQRYLSLPGVPSASAHYYLGLIAARQKRRLDAVVALQQALALGLEPELASAAQQRVQRLVEQEMTPAELEQVAARYPESAPGDLALLALARRHRDAGNLTDEMAALKRFTTAFPAHPEVPAAQARLRELTAWLTTDASRLGVLLPLSGPARLAGERALRGIELALAQLQAHDPAFSLSLVVRDSQGDSATAGQALRALVEEAHVIAVIGPLLSQVATALAPLAEELGVPLISPYARSSQFPLLSAYAFRNSLTDAALARFVAEYAFYTLQLRRFAVLYPQNAYGSALKDAFIEHAVRLGGTVVAATSYPPDATDFSPQIKYLGGIDDDALRDLVAPPAAPASPPPPLPRSGQPV